MSIIVDGYNYIGCSRELELSDPTAKDKVIYLMGQYCSKVHKALTLVFDGNYVIDLVNRKRQYGCVTVIYTSPIYTADEIIKKMVKMQEPKHRKALLVVSSDNEISQYTRSHGASAIRSEDFECTIARTLTSDQEIDRTNVRVSDQEVQEWLKIFGKEHLEHKGRGAEGIRKPVSKPEIGKPKITQAPTMKEKPEKSAEERTQPLRNRFSLKRKKRKHEKFRASQTEESIDRINIHLSSEEVENWMKLFGADAEE